MTSYAQKNHLQSLVTGGLHVISNPLLQLSWADAAVHGAKLQLTSVPIQIANILPIIRPPGFCSILFPIQVADWLGEQCHQSADDNQFYLPFTSGTRKAVEIQSRCLRMEIL